MFTKEKQDLIDSKDWDSLSKTDILGDFNFNTTAYMDYTFDKDFLTEFMFNRDRYKESKLSYADKANSTFYDDDNFRHLFRRMELLNIKLSTKEWREVINTADEYSNQIIQKRDYMGVIVSLTYKNSEFLKLLLDDTIYKRILTVAEDTYDHATITPKTFEGISDEDMKIILPRLSYGGKREITFEQFDETILLKYVDGIDGAIKLCEQNRTIKIAKVLKHLEPDEYLKVWKDYIGREIRGSITRYYWEPYFQEHKDYVATDDDIQILLDFYGEFLFNEISFAFTDEQLIKFGKYLDIKSLAKNDRISLSKITEIKGTGNFHLLNTRFFTEEEIIANPHFFDPEEITVKKRGCGLYISKDTFRLLNKAWGKRQRYNENLVRFDYIVSSLRADQITISTIKYLKNKAKISDQLLFSVLNNVYISPSHNEDGRKFNEFFKFINRYSGN